jgi:hypothetical protein
VHLFAAASSLRDTFALGGRELDFIEVFASALPAPLCEEFIATFEAHPAVHEGRTGGGVDRDKKRSRDLTFDAHPELHEKLARLQPYTLLHLARYFRRYPFALIGAVSPTLRDPQTGEPFVVDRERFAKVTDSQLVTLIKTIYRSGIVNLQRYERNVGGYPHWHSEIYPEDARCDPLHRVLFYMYYLNDVEEGGETEFYFQERSIVPRRGTMVIAPAGFTHTHRGNVPRSGDKYILTSWLMFRRSEELFRERPSK